MLDLFAIAKFLFSLPDAVVNSSTIKQFKNRLDRQWSKQEMVRDTRLFEGCTLLEDKDV